MTDTPARVRLQRRKGWRMPANTVKVDRSTGYGNPFMPGQFPGMAFAEYMDGHHVVKDAAHAVLLFQRLLIANLKRQDGTVDALLKLRGKNLACWCPLDQPCHADVLLKFANIPTEQP